MFSPKKLRSPPIGPSSVSVCAEISADPWMGAATVTLWPARRALPPIGAAKRSVTELPAAVTFPPTPPVTLTEKPKA